MRKKANTIKERRRIHLVGIKGAGMSALAVNLKQMGHAVTGSDHAEMFFTERLLAKHGLKALTPFAAKNIPLDTELVIASTAYRTDNNSELAEAKRRGLRF